MIRLLVLPVALSLLLGLAVFLPAADASTSTCVGTGTGPAVCVLRGPCYGVGLTTGATDFYPGAAVCKLPPGTSFFCGRAYAGVGTFGGFYGPDVHACVLGDAFVTLCAGVLGNNVDPVCL